MINSFNKFHNQQFLVITANQQQARFLRSSYTKHMLSKKRTAWISPEILPWQVWIKAIWYEQQLPSESQRLLLNPQQVRMLWQDIIQASHYSNKILQIRSIVDLVINAYEICKRWNITIFPHDIFLNQDSQAFESWVNSYLLLLLKNQWIDVMSLPDYLIETQFSPREKKLLFYGFDEFSYQESMFVDYLRVKGCDIEFQKFDSRSKKVSYLSYSNSQAEIQAAALWAKNIISNEADARVGVVIPDLHAMRQSVSNIFDEILHPDWAMKDPSLISRLYSIAPGKPLSSYPIIYSALEILSLGQPRHSVNKLGVLLRSSFIKGAKKEKHARSRFYNLLRRAGEPFWQLKTLLTFFDGNQEILQGDQSIFSILKEFKDCFDKSKKSQSTREWADTFDLWLKIFGWPGERELDSNEYQTLDAWQNALIVLASLETVMGKCNYQAALECLRNILKQDSFQPETEENPIQIISLHGVAGMQFDYLRIIGLHEKIWPERPRLNPFIPFSLQVQANLPGASAEESLVRCQKNTKSWVHSANNVVFSYPILQGEQQCRPSPILCEFQHNKFELADEEFKSFKQLIFESSEIEYFKDDIAPPVANTDKSIGGVEILSDQSACPFRSFAKHRLYAQRARDIDIGISASLRGLLLHKLMHSLWLNIKTLENLSKLTTKDLESIIRTAVRRVINQQARHKPETFSKKFQKLEHKRLQNIVTEWLNIESTRPRFKVKEVEQDYDLNFFGLNISTRIDRVDELPDGRLVILDYKTGESKISSWEGDRPDDPQLPFYAVTYKGCVKAIAYAVLKKGKLGFFGLSSDKDLISNLKVIDDKLGKTGWDAKLERWQQVLGHLANNFANGCAEVNPKKITSSCRYCDLHSLCRVHEIADDSYDSFISAQEDNYIVQKDL